MVPTKPFLHSNESCFLQIPHPPPYRTLRHLQLSCHGGDGRPAESLLVSPAPQIQVHGDGPIGRSLWYSFLRSVIFPLLPRFLFLVVIRLRGVDFASLTSSLRFLLLPLFLPLLLTGFLGR